MSTEKIDQEATSSASVHSDEIDIYSYHEKYAGRLVIDPVQAKIELGESVASKLKLNEDGTKILWPQPTDSSRDPQNWTRRQKNIQLLIITLVSIVPDMEGTIGIAALFALAREYNTNPNVINNLTSNWNIFLLGWGGIPAIILIRRLGRLPVIFWSQVFALGMQIGCTFAPNLNTFAAMRSLNGFFATAPQIAGLYLVTDMYPFHLQARKLNIWTMGFILSPFISPFAFGFLVARQDWRWAYGISCFYGLFTILLMTFFMKETIYDRTLKPIPEPKTTGLRYRVETLIGITGWHMQKYRISWYESVISPLRIVWRPHLLAILIYEGMLFGFSIGINVTTAIFLETPVEKGGYGFNQNQIAASYATPLVSVIIGEVIGRYLNDWIMNISIRRNNGVYEAESRLWAQYVAVPLYVGGFIAIGTAIQKQLTIGALIMGWGLAETAVMISTVSAYAYCADSFPKNNGEISALINLARVLGGFATAYYQVPWAEKYGAIQTFGCEASIVVGLFVLFVPFVQIKGRALRAKYSLH